MPEDRADAAAAIQRLLEQQRVSARTAITAPTLEDVFVAATMKPMDRAA